MSPAHPSCAETKLRVQEKLFSQVFLIEPSALQVCAIFLFGMKMMIIIKKPFYAWLSRHRRVSDKQEDRERERKREKEREREKEKGWKKEKEQKK